jgi:hypothetical protein
MNDSRIYCFIPDSVFIFCLVSYFSLKIRFVLLFAIKPLFIIVRIVALQYKLFGLYDNDIHA